ncbi:MAG: hypothetical protein GQ570_15510 [Helicobacteraceae bacterium]|nr:hypothetical protein [Helicobacteraceae bacterium]
MLEMQNNYFTLVIHEHHNIENLKLQINALKKQLHKLNIEKDKYLNLIIKFQKEHNHKLGSLIDRIVEFEKEKNTKHTEEYQDYKSFINKHTKAIHVNRYVFKPSTLKNDEKQELKTLYRKSAKLCHPDTVHVDLKEQSHLIFQELNHAYSEKNLIKIRDILHSLNNNHIFTSQQNINDIEFLKSQIFKIKKTIKTVKLEIYKLKKDDTYILITDIGDWNEYFRNIEVALNREYEELLCENNSN